MAVHPTTPPDAMRATVRTAAVAVTAGVFAAGAVAGIRDLGWALVAAAVVFGWSQLSGA